MNKFEDIFKQAVEGYEAPFNPQAWDNVSNELGDSFDQLMKDSTNSYEAPFNPAAWEAVNSQLGPAYSAWKWIGGSAAVLAILTGATYLLNNSDAENEIATHPSSEVIVHNDNIVDNTIHMNDVNSDHIADNSLDNSNAIHVNENPINAIENNGLNNNGLQVIDPDENNINQGNNNAGNNNGNTPVINPNPTGNQNPGGNGNPLITEPEIDYKANASFRLSNPEICQGEKCTFTPQNINEDLHYIWTYGDGEISRGAIGEHKFKKDGDFDITLEIKNPRTHKTIATSTETIVVNELPKTEFSWNQEYQGIPTVNFVNNSFDSEVVLWSIKGLKQSTNGDFEYTFRKEGDYTVALTTINDNGCRKTVEKSIEIKEDYNLLAPAAFTPNGDQFNNGFMPVALQTLDVPFTMTVMDKSGKLVYSTQNAYEPWDGRFTEDNTLAPSGSSYIWRVVLTNSNGEREYYEGQVHVL